MDSHDFQSGTERRQHGLLRVTSPGLVAGDGAVLLGWWASGPAGEPELGGPIGHALTFPTHSMAGAVTWRLHHLRDDPGAPPEGRHLRWTLAVADRPAEAAKDRAFWV